MATVAERDFAVAYLKPWFCFFVLGLVAGAAQFQRSVLSCFNRNMCLRH
jgi:hypothetical protein